jgi:excisionase family DNA binding protein
MNSFIRALAEGVQRELQHNGYGSTAGAAAITPRLLTVDQAAVYLGRSKASVQHLVAQRRIPIVREGRRIFLDVRELDRWIAVNTEPAQV